MYSILIPESIFVCFSGLVTAVLYCIEFDSIHGQLWLVPLTFQALNEGQGTNQFLFYSFKTIEWWQVSLSRIIKVGPVCYRVNIDALIMISHMSVIQ